MPIDSDNTAERDARIDALLAQIAEQKRRLLDQGIALWTLTEKVHRAMLRPELTPQAPTLH